MLYIYHISQLGYCSISLSNKTVDISPQYTYNTMENCLIWLHTVKLHQRSLCLYYTCFDLMLNYVSRI